MPDTTPWAKYVEETVLEAARLRTEALDLVLTESFDSEAHSTRIEVGAKVAYAAEFLRSIGYAGTCRKTGRMLVGCTNPIWFARGRVLSLKEISPEVVLAVVKWQDKNWRDWPSKVNVKNLARVGPNLRFTGW